jgi:CopG antitoxin of type II toxin-antitoxin system
MPKNNKQRDPIPQHFTSIAEAAEFWDSHDLTDYWDLTQEASFEVDIQRRSLSDARDPSGDHHLTDCKETGNILSRTS